MTQDTIEVRPNHRFDERGLHRFMRANVEGYVGPARVVQFEGGQSNPTYLLHEGGRRYVLRRKPPGKLLPSAHAVEREYRVISALAPAGVPVPRTLALCEDPGVIGTAFFLMEYVEGRVFRERDDLDVTPAERGAIFAAMAEVLATLHQVDYVALGLGDYGRPGNYFQRQIGRWSKMYRASETVPIPAMEKLIDRLPGLVPQGEETSIVHGDYRLGNMIVHPSEPRIVALLDWELSTVGHPLADLAYSCMNYHLDAEEMGGLEGLELASHGIPAEEEFVAAYCRHTGRDSIPDWPFYLAFSFFRIAAISQGIMGRARDGTASAPDAAERGARAPRLAEIAWEIIQPLAAG
ncbi:MAG: phosphotransferase [bacterium]